MPMSDHPPSRPPLAIIYLPPILAENPEAELDLVGAKLAGALDRHASDGAGVFRTATEFVEVRGKKEKVCRILRADRDGQNERPLADLFRLDYRPRLLARYRDGRLATKCLLAGLGLIEMGRRVLAQWFRPRHHLLSRPERFQSVFALGMMLVVALYLFTLVLGAVKIVDTALHGALRGTNEPPAVAVTNADWTQRTNAGWLPGTNGWALWRTNAGVATNFWLVKTNVSVVPTNGFFAFTNWGFAGTNAGLTNWGMFSTNWGPFLPPAPPPKKPAWERFKDFFRDLFGLLLVRPVRWLYEVSELAFVALVALGLLSKDRGQVTEFIRKLSEEMLAFVYYLSFADRRAEITGEVDEFMEALTEAGPRYRRHALLGYSFGSIVALDAFCPADDVRARRLDCVDTLVTIGSPYDFILTYWPDYFANRSPKHGSPANWLNIYSPVDVLGSQFHKRGAASAEGHGEVLENSFGQPGRLAKGPTEEVAFRENFVCEDLTWTSTLMLLGLRAHSMYWSRDEQHERNCFHLIAPRLFPEEFVETNPSAAARPAVS